MSNEDSILTEIVPRLAQKLGLKEWSYKTEIFNETKHNCFGVLIPMKLTGIKSEKSTTYNFICKIAPNNKLKDATRAIYATEIFVYEKLFMAFDALKCIRLTELVPECIYTFENKVLVLKDMRSDGFKMCSEAFDLRHVKLALEALAQFHGLSFILRKRGAFEEKTPYNEKHSFVEVFSDYLNEHINLFKNTRVYSTIDSFIENFDEIVRDTVSKPKHFVYGHGDFWKENILFKYKGDVPVKACLLDFQYTRLMCSAQEVLFFINACVATELRRNHFKEIISTYIKALHEIINNNGLGDVVYTEEEFINDMQIVAPYCLIHAMFSVSFWMGVEFSRMTKIFGEVQTSKEEQVQITEHYKKRVVEMILDNKYFGLCQ